MAWTRAAMAGEQPAKEPRHQDRYAFLHAAPMCLRIATSGRDFQNAAAAPSPLSMAAMGALSFRAEIAEPYTPAPGACLVNLPDVQCLGSR